MKIILRCIGKTDNKALQVLIDDYSKRLNHYIKFNLEVIPDIKKAKNLSEEQQKEKEGTLLLQKLQITDHLLLLDERGDTYSSTQFSKLLQKKMNAGYKSLFILIGGPYGFSKAVYQRANGKISLSKMTFSHQMVRLFITEQIYRGFTILKGEPYHHE